MNTYFLPFKHFAVLFVLIFSIAILAQTSSASTISGMVYDKQRNALPEVDMELLNEYYQLRGRTKTDGLGRYEFSGLPDGFYTVRALPFRYDLEDQDFPVEIQSLNVRGAGQGNTIINQDFYLTPKKGGIDEAEAAVIFAQEIPKEAREKYRDAVKELSNKRQQEGVTLLFEAIKTYPQYYDALYRMGKELYIVGKYDEAWQYLLEATKVNEKSGPAFFYMGYSFYRLGPQYKKASLTAFKQAAVLNPNSMRVWYALGLVEREMGNYTDAEKHLLQAKKLADKPQAEIQKELAQLYSENLKKYNEAADELEIYVKAAKMSDEDKKSTRVIIQGLRDKAKNQPH